MSRTSNSIRNFLFGTAGHFLGYLFNFITRKIFVVYLSVEYLGLNGLFSNILSMLSLMELGIGTAICYSLYHPLAFDEQHKIVALMQFYRKAYTLIGSLVIVIGLSLTPLLPSLLGEVPDIPYISLIYALFVINSGSTYFLSYKRTILVADQKKYIDTNYQYGFQVLRSLIQIGVLVLTKNYILFLCVMLAITLLENISITRKINSLYPYLVKKDKVALEPTERTQIKKNVFALTFHKMGGVIVNGTDNILIVKFISLASAGIYSNYIMIITALNSVVSIAFNSISASIGNLAVEQHGEGSKAFFDQLNFVTAWIYGFSSISLYVLFNQFITLWLGSEFLFAMPIVFVIIINFYLGGMLRPVRTFNASMGLFWFDRYKPIFESIINLVASILLAIKFGFIGIIIGTTISTLTTCFWFEPYVLFKHGFELNVSSYFLKYVKYLIISLLAGFITQMVVHFNHIEGMFGAFLLNVVICAVVPNLVFLLVYYPMREFQYLKALGMKLFQAVEGRRE